MPYTIAFSDHLFFLIAEKIDGSKRVRRHYRLDRISSLRLTNDHYRIETGSGFLQVGEYCNQSFHMFDGEPTLVRLKIQAWVEEYLRVRHPNIKVVKTLEDGKYSVVELVVRGTKGIVYWILSQREWVEVLSPPSLREEICQAITQMGQLYNQGGKLE